MTDDRMPIIIASSDRQPQYIEQTLESMYERDPVATQHFVRIIVCGPCDDYLHPCLERLHVARGVRPWTDTLAADEWERIERLPGKHRTADNLFRGLCREGSGLFLQDDLEFSERWLVRTAALIEILRARHGAAPFMLSLYSPYAHSERPIASYPATCFYGTQALYMNDAAASGLHGVMLAELRRNSYRADDIMVKEYLLRTAVPLYAANPSLVQHIGLVSAIEQRYHESPSFESP